MKNYEESQNQSHPHKTQTSTLNTTNQNKHFLLSNQAKSPQHTEDSLQLQRIREGFDNATCVQQKEGMLLCCNPKCEQNAVICSVKKCPCKSRHKICYTAQFDGFLQKYARKIDQQTKAIQQVENIFMKLIDSISELQENIITEMKGAFITNNQKKFFLNIQSQEFSLLKGKQLSRAFPNISYQTQLQDASNKKISSWMKNLGQLSEQTVDSLRGFEKKANQWKCSNNNNSNKLSQQPLQLKQINTNILITQQQFLTLRQFFPNNPISKLNLLYRASQESFSIDKFYKKCSSIPNTLILIKTEYNKIIGGFTPLVWKKYQQPSIQLKDQSKESFIFSITEKDKFVLEEPYHATYYLESSPGPRFGKNGFADLWICNSSNKERSSYVFAHMAYTNEKYGIQKDSYLKFTGGPTEYFTTKEWEVFQVQFQGKQ